MIDDFYQAALAAIHHHLDEAGAAYSLDEGEIIVDGHRLGLSITFDGYATQGVHTLAPLEIQIHVDGDSGDRFRVGALGVGSDQASAKQDAVAEWHLLAVAPLLAALGAPVENRRAAARPQQLAGWDLFPGRIGIRGRVPPELRSGGEFYRSLLDPLRSVVSAWDQPPRFELHSIYIMASNSPEGRDVQAAIDGLLNAELVQRIGDLSWPKIDEAYLFKQLFVLRHQPRD